MEGTKYTTKAAVLKRGREIIGIPLGEVDKTGRLATGKGAIGTVIEESWFGYSPNSESEPDFPEAGVELKATPYVTNRNGTVAKERLVCNIINYMEEYDKTFLTSSFWHKCNTILIMSYEHIKFVPKNRYTIDEVVLFQFPNEDLVVIEQDWEEIMAKIRAGKAHELSEGDTYYLAACTKGTNANSLREQPFSSLPAMQRAYSLKKSYMTSILNKYVYGDEESERIIKDWQVLEDISFEEYITRQLEPFIGMTIPELKEELGVHTRAKNVVPTLVARMLGLEGKLADSEEFKKASIIPKTVRLLPNGKPKEALSFPTFDFREILRTSWEDYELCESLSSSRFMFIIFQSDYTNNIDEMIDDYSVSGDNRRQAPRGVTDFRFKGIKMWNMPEKDVAEFGRVYDRTVRIVEDGVKMWESARGTSNNLPKAAESPVAHVRPHTVSGDKVPLPDGRMITRQSFWLNASYIGKQLEELDDIYL